MWFMVALQGLSGRKAKERSPVAPWQNARMSIFKVNIDQCSLDKLWPKLKKCATAFQLCLYFKSPLICSGLGSRKPVSWRDSRSFHGCVFKIKAKARAICKIFLMCIKHILQNNWLVNQDQEKKHENNKNNMKLRCQQTRKRKISC